jgi:fatty acid desaturase
MQGIFESPYSMFVSLISLLIGITLFNLSEFTFSSTLFFLGSFFMFSSCLSTKRIYFSISKAFIYIGILGFYAVIAPVMPFWILLFLIVSLIILYFTFGVIQELECE